ncbi:maleylpyruvate isomerase N-terminal domain-containing protein [Streptomyces orinoci]|uniref:Maleylpyruvate isomerase N-terminal domain-containing protein n=1 Tax=Streptomyces orinoci TaxID=67339 RepID=A0ABV3JVK4_STRON|nr:maleylpyruvate isomerase N-terminal domain-containing protein [Streptomyces orinoci]
MPSTRLTRSPITPDDLEEVLRQAVAVCRAAPAAAWTNPAGELEWDCWETVSHLADDMFCYALQLAPPMPPLDGYVPTVFNRLRPGGPNETVHADRNTGLEGLLQVLEGCTGLLAAVVRTKSPETRAYHTFGVADPEGFAAMGVVEALVHMEDVAQGLGAVWKPPLGICERVMARLFPDVAIGEEGAWRALLWATGRIELPGRPRRTSWRWNGVPEGEANGA